MVAVENPAEENLSGLPKGMMGSSYEDRRLDSSICCLIDSGERCRRLAGRNSIPSGWQKLSQKRNLRLEIDKKMTHAYICSFHAEMISKKRSGGSSGSKQQRSNGGGSGHNGSGSSNGVTGSLKWLQESTSVKGSSSKMRSTPQSIHYDDISDPDDDSDSELVMSSSGRKMVHSSSSRRDHRGGGGGGVQIQVNSRHRDMSGLRGMVGGGGGKKMSSVGGGGSSKGGVSGGGVQSSGGGSSQALALNLLLPKSLKKCRKFFKINSMAPTNKAQLIEVLQQHIREMKVSEKDVIKRFLIKVNDRRNARGDNDYN